MFNIYSHKSLVRSSVRQLLSQECKEEEAYESYFQTVASHPSRRWYLFLLSSQMGTATFNSSLWTHTFYFYSLHSISCLQSTISPQPVPRSQHCGRCKSLKKLLGTRKSCLMLTYSPYLSVYSDCEFSKETTQVKGAKSWDWGLGWEETPRLMI